MPVSKIGHAVKGQVTGVVEIAGASFGVFPSGAADYRAALVTVKSTFCAFEPNFAVSILGLVTRT